MANNIAKGKFKTDAFKEALKKNEKMNKSDEEKKDDPIPAEDAKHERFTTDAFKEALKINEEMNKKDKSLNSDKAGS